MLLTLAASGTAVSGAGAAGTAAESVAAQSIQTRVTNSSSSARRSHSSEAWRRMGLRAVRRAAGREIRRELDCTATSFGQVREFFASTPCRSMHQTQPVLCDEHGNTITVSITWVRMPTPVSAQRWKLLIDTDGTGSVSTSQGVRFTGKHYSSRRTGSLVVIAETAPGGRSPGTRCSTGSHGSPPSFRRRENARPHIARDSAVRTTFSQPEMVP